MRLDVINLIIDLIVGKWYNLVSTQQIHVFVCTNLTHMYFLLTIYRVNGESNGTPLHYSCLENPMDGRVWWAAVHGVAKSRTRLSDFTFTFHFPALEKKMAIHSSVLAWRIPGMGEPGGLPSMGSHRVGDDWSNSAAAAAAYMVKANFETFSVDMQMISELLSYTH